MEWSEGGRKWDNCNSIINKYIFKKTHLPFPPKFGGKMGVRFIVQKRGKRNEVLVLSNYLFFIFLNRRLNKIVWRALSQEEKEK